MKMLALGLLILLIALVSVACSHIKSTDVINFVLSDRHYERTEVMYGKLPRQRMDIYRPKMANNQPPIIFVYGGAWVAGSKEDFEFVAHAFTALGHTVIIPNYRLHPEVKFPAFIDDIADAVAYTEQNADRLLGEALSAFILMGHSAGAHTAALLTTDTRYFRERDIKAKQAALVAISGPYDLWLDDPEVMPIFPNAHPAEVKAVLQVHTDMPPVLLLHGDADIRVSPKHTLTFAEALFKAGVLGDMHMYSGVNHTYIIGSLAAPLRFLSPSYDDIRQFLQKLPE